MTPPEMGDAFEGTAAEYDERQATRAAMDDAFFASLDAHAEAKEARATPLPERARLRADIQGDTATYVADALEYMGQDFHAGPRFEWDRLHDVVGHLLPYWFMVVAAATGNGKSTVLMSIVKHFLRQGWPVYMLPLEQPAHVMALYLAALELGYPPSLVLENRYGELPRDAEARVKGHLRWQATKGAELLHFDKATDVGERELEQVYTRAQAFGAKLVIVDHLHRLRLDGPNDYSALRRIAKTSKELAKSYAIPNLSAAQLHRDKEGDPLAPYKPPKSSAIQGGEVILQEADVGFGLYRPLLPDFDPSSPEAKLIRMGHKPLKDVLEKNAVGIHMFKHRIRGEAKGDIIKLEYRYGQIVCPDTEARLADEQRRGLFRQPYGGHA